MKWLVHTEELCSRSVPLEQNPGAVSLPGSSFQLALYITPSPAMQLTFVGALYGSLVFCNRPFYNYVLSYPAYDCKRRWMWPCFDTDHANYCS